MSYVFMATPTTKPGFETTSPSTGLPGWPNDAGVPGFAAMNSDEAPPRLDALHALLAFSALHEQVRRRKALASPLQAFDSTAPAHEFEPDEQFVLDEVLQLVAERAVAITGADGLAIALAENNEIVLRAAAGTVRPDIGARIDRDSAFSGACFRTAQVVNCDDTETDPRVNLQACRKLGARSMVAVPLCGRRRVIGVLEAFSTWPFGFNDSDVRNLTLLAELVLAALKPEDEDRFAQSAQAAEAKLADAKLAPAPLPVAAPEIALASTAETAAIKHTEVKVETPAKIESLAAAPSAPVPSVSVAPKPAAEVVVPKPTIKDASTVLPTIGMSAAAIPVVPTIAPAKPAAAEPLANVNEQKTVTAATAQVAALEPELTFGLPEAERSPRKIGLPLLLVGIVVLVLAAAGVFWKIGMGHVGKSVVTNEESASTTQASTAQKTSPPAIATPGTTPSAPSASDEAGSDDSPAAPQELSRFPRVTGIRHWSAPDASSVALDLEDQVQYEAHRLTGPDRIYFDLHDTQLGADLAGKSIEVGDAFIGRIRVAQPVAGMTRIVLETKPDTNFSVSLESNPYRLIVAVHKVGASPKGAVNLFPNAETEKNKLSIVIPPPTKEDLQLRARVPKMRIVVDAGHGGWDLGTVGRRGLLEKDVVLEVAQRLGKLLETRLGTEVIYTRNDDNYIPLDERAELANQSQADLFISVHANYSDLPSARGVETYYTNFFSAPGSKEASPKDGTPEGHAVLSGVKSAQTPLLSPADLHERIEQSRKLAASVQRSLYGTLSVKNPGLRDRGIKEAGFVVLTESAMPGILAEVSFVSSPTDEQKLRSDGYREQIAEALYKGIARYAANSHPTKLASAAK